MTISLTDLQQNLDLWRWRQRTGGVLQFYCKSTGNWVDSLAPRSDDYAAKAIYKYRYRKKPDPERYWLNVFDDRSALVYRCEKSALADAKAQNCQGFTPIAIAVPVDLPPGTLVECAA